MRNMIGVIPLVKGDGRMGPSKSCWGSEGMDGVHQRPDDVALPTGLVRLGAPEDHETVIGLRELDVVLWGGVRWLC
jgi:hypothetical protein